MIFSISSRLAAAYSAAVGYRANRVGVTRLTRLSVVCADRIVATSSSSGVLKFSSVYTSGYITASSRSIRRARRTRAVCEGGGAVCEGGGAVCEGGGAVCEGGGEVTIPA